MSLLNRLARIGVALTLTLATVVWGVPAAHAQQGVLPQKPQQDPFYQPPDGYEKAEPGTVLRQRRVEIAAAAALPVKIEAWQLLYRSTDSHGNPFATVTTVMMPWNFQPDEDRPLLSYQVFENSIAMHCAPSYQLQRSYNWENAATQIELILIAAAVRQGWAVTVPDHLGPHGAYVAGQVEGHATLDAIRATESFEPLGLAGDDTRVGLWGYSGGAHATGWATQLQPSYAPELNVVGAATGGIPPDLRSVFDKIDGGFAAGIALTGVVGLTREYPDLKEYVDDHVNIRGRISIDTLQKQCLPTNFTAFAFTRLEHLFTVQDPLDQPIPRQVLAENRMSPDVRTAPMFVYHSIPDEIIPIGPTDAFVKGRCAAGSRVTYEREYASEHIIAAATVGPDALIWLKDRLEGPPAPSGCSTKTVGSALSKPESLAVFGQVLIDSLLDIAGRPVGPPGWGAQVE